MHSGDVPGGFHRCANFSGPYVSTYTQFGSSGTDQKYWEAATKAGALDAWIEIYTEGNSCLFYGTAGINPNDWYLTGLPAEPHS